MTGFRPSTASGPGQIFGDLHVADAEAAQAKTDLTTAYNDAAGRGPEPPLRPTSAGARYWCLRRHGHDVNGTHRSLTLNAKGDPNAVFIFQAGST